MQNEYGLAAWMSIIGIEILNEGGGLSIDDITNESQVTYVAKAKTAWVPWTTEAEAAPGTDNFYAGTGQQSQGETAVFPFPQDNTLDEYKNWASISGSPTP
jgi:hypothetical protein